jgi:hypothetical protein
MEIVVYITVVAPRHTSPLQFIVPCFSEWLDQGLDCHRHRRYRVTASSKDGTTDAQLVSEISNPRAKPLQELAEVEGIDRAAVVEVKD